MFIQDIKTIIAIELKKIASGLSEGENSANDLIKAFEESLQLEKGAKPLKVKRQTVILENDIRCLALKKDGERCNGRRKAEGTLCPIHQRTGVKFGSYVQQDSDNEVVSSSSKTVVKEKKTKAVIKSEKEVISKILERTDSEEEDDEDEEDNEDEEEENSDREEFEF
jgi:hypothetical protein